MCRVLGDLLQEGIVTKIADDLYCGGNTPQELFDNLTKLLQAIHKCGLKLSPSKTVICPKTTNILGWLWQQGTITASPHRVAALASCEQPQTVKGLRSFIGAFKVLSRVVPNTASLLAPLEDLITGARSSDRLSWSEHALDAFRSAQKRLSSSKTIVIPRPDDQLWLVTDAAVKDPGIGATLYVIRSAKLHLAGFFSAKLHQRQLTWLPCEVEALAIAAATKHFGPFIIQASSPIQILTDSKPCVQAYQRLCRGEFSASPRLTTFLSTVSRFQAVIRHLAGTANLPTDFASRNAPPCLTPECQVCTFVKSTSEASVLRIDVAAVLSGSQKLPYTTRSTWLNIQSECPDLRRTRAHLKQGTRPSKKATNIRDIKRYLQVATIAHDGLLVVKRQEPLGIPRECIIVPREVLHGLLTSLHVQLNHPTPHQLQVAVQRHFYALDLITAVHDTTSGCHMCASLLRCPKFAQDQTSIDPPESPGLSFAADIMKRDRLLVLVVRETVTSFTVTTILESEQKPSEMPFCLCACPYLQCRVLLLLFELTVPLVLHPYRMMLSFASITWLLRLVAPKTLTVTL